MNHISQSQKNTEKDFFFQCIFRILRFRLDQFLSGRWSIFLVLLLILNSCMKQELVAEEKKVEPVREKDRGLIHTYYDGNEAKKVILLPDYVAEISSAKSKYKDLDKTSLSVVEGNRLRIHKVGSAGIRSFLNRGSLPSSMQNGNYSPVFSPSGSDSQMMTLPGSLVVELDRDYSQAEVESFARTHKMNYQRKIPIPGKNFYVFETEPGFPCLDKANELKSKPGVLSSSPEWFQKAFPR